MTSQLPSPQPISWLAAAAAAVALAPTAASAAPTEEVPHSSSACETHVFAKYRVPARVPIPRSCEELMLPSRGAAAPARSLESASTPTEARTFPGLAAQASGSGSTAATRTGAGSSDSGFDWISAAVGGAVTAGLLAVAWLAAIAASRRGRLRAAR